MNITRVYQCDMTDSYTTFKNNTRDTIDRNITDAYYFNQENVTITINDYFNTRVNTSTFYPAYGNLTSTTLFGKIRTTVIEPWYTFIYLENSAGDTFLQHLDDTIFGDQSSIDASQRFRFYSNYLKEIAITNTTTTRLHTPDLIKNTWFSDKALLSENTYLYLYLNNSDASVSEAFNIFNSVNNLQTTSKTGTILESVTNFIAKWKELLLNANTFRKTSHHPVFDGNYCWNKLPLSLRRKWIRGDISISDPFLELVNCCMAPILAEFFPLSSSNTWPLYEEYVSMNPATFDPQYFRVPGPTTTCFYYSLPAIWCNMNGYNEIEGLWNTVQYIMRRSTHVLRMPSYNLTTFDSSNVTATITADSVQNSIRTVDRSQRWLSSYIQTLNNSECEIDDLGATSLNQFNLTEIGYLFNTKRLTGNDLSNQTFIADTIDRVPTHDHTDNRYNQYNKIVDTSIYTTNLTYLTTTNITTDTSANATIYSNLVNITNETMNFSTGSVDTPSELQQLLLEDESKNSINKSIQYARQYIVEMANTDAEVSLYLTEFFNGAVPSTVDITVTTVGSVGSAQRNAFYLSIEEYLWNYIKNSVITKLRQVSNDLSFRFNIRPLNYRELLEEIESNDSSRTLVNNAAPPTSTNETLYNETIHHIIWRHSSRVSVNSSDVFNLGGFYTPQNKFQVSPNSAISTYDYKYRTRMSKLEYDWNELPLFPTAFDQTNGILLDSAICHRYQNSVSSPTPIRRPLTYGNQIEIQKQISDSSGLYNHVGQPIETIGNYGKQYILDNSYSPSNNQNSQITSILPNIENALYNPYTKQNRNLETTFSILPRRCFYPLYDILSNDINDIIPRVITGDSLLELNFELNPFVFFLNEWSSSTIKQADYLANEAGNYLIRDIVSRPGLSEFELRNPFRIENEPSYIRQVAENITKEGTSGDVINFSELQGDVRNFRLGIYNNWAGMPLITDNLEFNINRAYTDTDDQLVLQNITPWYGRYRRRVINSRLTTGGQLSALNRALRPQFDYYGFVYPQSYIDSSIKTSPYVKRYRYYQQSENNQITKNEETIRIETNKQIFDMRFHAHHGNDVTINRGIENRNERIMYMTMNPCLYSTLSRNDSSRYYHYIDGGGLWLGTDEMAIRLQQLGINPNDVLNVEQKITLTQDTLDSIPVFDTNFTFSGEIHHPVLVEYPTVWKDLHGTIIQQEVAAPYMQNIERPLILWSSNQRFKEQFFRSISLDINGDLLGPEYDETFYHDRFSYDHFDRICEPNIYGIQFGLGYWKVQPKGYMDFGAINNINDPFFNFKQDQLPSTLNTNVEKIVNIHIDMAWQNIQYIRDGLLFTRYIA